MISRRDGVFCYTDIESFNNHIIRSNICYPLYILYIPDFMILINFKM